MTCARPEPCLPCQVNRPCAHVLQLDIAQQKRLARVLELCGESPTWSAHRTKSTRVLRGVMDGDVEPTKLVECPDCGAERTWIAYLHDFLVSNHVRLPVCSVCAAARRAA